MGLLSRLARSAGAQLDAFASKLSERLTYKTGEIAGAGTLQCLQCEQQLAFDKATRIPPCPKCRGTLFRRSF
jgi:NAD-dependent SIR2 family protein deacetylase